MHFYDFLKRDIKNALFLETYLYNCGHDVLHCNVSKIWS